VNKRLVSSAFLLVLVGGFLGCVLSFGEVYASREVSGIIDSYVVWKKVNSPFNLTGPVLVDEEAILTIEPGVTVNLNGHYIRVAGTLHARGEVSDKIYFLGGSSKPPNWPITFMASSIRWNGLAGSGCVLENVVVEGVHAGVSINGGAPRVDSNVISGYYAVDVLGGSVVISNNTINGEVGVHGGSAVGDFATIVGNNITGCIVATDTQHRVLIANNTVVDGGKNEASSGIVCSNAYVHDNVVYGFTAAGMKVNFTWGRDAMIERNLVMYNSVGINVSQDANPTIQYNTITNNSVGIEVNQYALPVIHYNNIQNNSQNSIYLAVNSNDINATDNWWGTTEMAAINQTIFDFEDDFNLGTVSFVPFLNATHPDAPSAAFTPEPTLTPGDSSPDSSTSLRDLEVAILALLIVIAGLLVVTIFLLSKKR
jgi:parallel beta-helix repeat protein